MGSVKKTGMPSAEKSDAALDASKRFASQTIPPGDSWPRAKLPAPRKRAGSAPGADPTAGRSAHKSGETFADKTSERDASANKASTEAAPQAAQSRGATAASEKVNQEPSQATAPGRAAASLFMVPDLGEQSRVNKKAEKRTSASAALEDCALVAGSEANVDSAAGPAQKAGTKTVERPSSKSTKAGGARQGFRPNEFIVYPAHGVGQIIAIEEQEVAGFKLELFVISFVKDKMILKVPTPKVASVGMRKLAEADIVRKALDTLAGRARVKRTMWSRRAQEYEAKINSGDLVAIAEVVRDLYRSDTQPEQSYSERQLYEAALDRMTREVVIVQKLTETESLKVIETQLQKSPRRGKSEEAEIEETDSEIEEAA